MEAVHWARQVGTVAEGREPVLCLRGKPSRECRRDVAGSMEFFKRKKGIWVSKKM